jgi:hypothetical protein
MTFGIRKRSRATTVKLLTNETARLTKLASVVRSGMVRKVGRLLMNRDIHRTASNCYIVVKEMLKVSPSWCGPIKERCTKAL